MAEELDWLLNPENTDLDPSQATPITVLTGFLGAGKTTLLNRILTERHGLRIAVLVNDFGEVNIDAELIVGVGSATVDLANGCVCCEVRDDLIAAIDAVLRRETEIDAIVLEASGVAEPIAIARTFTSPELRDRIRVDGIVAVVDAEQLPAQTNDPVTRDLVFGQIGFSDLIILNKIDLADRDEVNEVRRFVLQRLPGVRIIETIRADVPLEVLVGAGPDSEPRAPCDDDHAHPSAHRFTSWVYRRDGVFDVAALHSAIQQLPRHVYRVKGFLSSADEPGRRQLLQAVGMRGDIQPFDNWGDRPRLSELVIVADAEGVDPRTVEALLDDCLVGSPARDKLPKPPPVS